MKLIERRITALEARPRPPDAASEALQRETVEFLCTWATPAETDYLLGAAARQEHGAALHDDEAAVERLRCRWNARFEDDAVTAGDVTKAHRPDWREPQRALGDRWGNWLTHFHHRDERGDVSAEDRATWWKLADLTEHFIIRRQPLPEGLDRLEHGELEDLWLAVPAELRSL